MDIENATQKEIAELFGVSATAVRKWKCPKLKTGGYDARAVMAWRIGELVERARKDAVDETTELMGDGQAMKEYRETRTAIAKLELAEKQKELVRWDEVRDQLVSWLDAHSKRLHQMPATIAGRLASVAPESEVAQIVERALKKEVERSRAEIEKLHGEQTGKK